ncbi:MAG: tetratricopeptide repeat protein [Candidatus Sericytochromatia bacterium]|nr:tetratricopeptide repeat protein [Candidatus Sericytochromatia bacterium]
MALRIAKARLTRTPATLLREAYAAIERQDRPEAIARLLDLLELTPDDATSYRHLAVLLVDEGALDRALLSAREALRLEPDQADTCNVLGFILYQLGWTRTATMAFRRALALQEDHPGARENLLACIAHERNQGSAEEPAELDAVRTMLEVRQPRLSLCMIVKNEEEVLDACLSSVRGFVDEICIVDTGSTDGTLAIAEAHGARIGHHAWTGDFAEARNKSLEMATGDWILVLDADEELAPESGPLLRETLRRRDHGAFGLVIDNALGGGAGEVQRATILRLFRNLPEMRFWGRVHEQIFPAMNEVGVTSGEVAVRLIHKGYTEEMMTRRNKNQRNLDLLLQQERELPEPHPYNQFHLGNQYKRLGEPGKAEQHYRKAIELLHAVDPWTRAPYHAPLLYGLVLVLRERGALEEAAEWAEKAIRIFPDSANCLHQLALIRLSQGDVDTAMEVLDRVLTLKDRPFAGGTDLGVFDYLNDAARGVCLARQGKLDEARECLQRAVDASPKALPAVEVNLATVELAKGMDLAGTDRLARIVAEHPEEAGAWLLLAQHHIKRGNLAESLALLGQACSTHPEIPDFHHERADLLLRLGRVEEAIRVLEKMHSLAEGTRRAGITLGVARLIRGDADAGTRLKADAMASDDAETRKAWLATAHLLDCCLGLPGEPGDLLAVGFAPAEFRAQWQGLLRTLLAHGRADAIEHMLRVQATHEAALPGLGKDLAIILLGAGFEDPALALLLAHRESHPEDATTYLHLARICLARNLFEDGVELLQESIRLDPGLSMARRMLVRMRKLARAAATTAASAS